MSPVEQLKAAMDVPCWSTAEMQLEFEVLGFAMGYCIVRRRIDGVRGSLEFNHSPRVYFNFEPE